MILILRTFNSLSPPSRQEDEADGTARCNDRSVNLSTKDLLECVLYPKGHMQRHQQQTKPSLSTFLWQRRANPTRLATFHPSTQHLANFVILSYQRALCVRSLEEFLILIPLASCCCVKAHSSLCSTQAIAGLRMS